VSLNGQERKTFDEYLTALTGAVVESASSVVQDHADRCYDQNLKPINDKLDLLLKAYNERHGRMVLLTAISTLFGGGVLSAIVLGILAAVH